MDELNKKTMSGEDILAFQTMMQNVLNVIRDPNWSSYIDDSTHSDLIRFVEYYFKSMIRVHEEQLADEEMRRNGEINIPPDDFDNSSIPDDLEEYNRGSSFWGGPF